MTTKELVRQWLTQGEELLLKLEEPTAKTKVKEVIIEKKVEVPVEKIIDSAPQLRIRIKEMVSRKKIQLVACYPIVSEYEGLLKENPKSILLPLFGMIWKNRIDDMKEDILELEELLI